MGGIIEEQKRRVNEKVWKRGLLKKSVSMMTASCTSLFSSPEKPKRDTGEIGRVELGKGKKLF